MTPTYVSERGVFGSLVPVRAERRQHMLSSTILLGAEMLLAKRECLGDTHSISRLEEELEDIGLGRRSPFRFLPEAIARSWERDLVIALEIIKGQ